MIESKKVKEMPRGLLVFALVFLTNPVVNIFDYLPDVFGYVIIAASLVYLADRSPYFAEARVAFIRLAFVSAAKIPAYFIMVYARGQNVSDNDIKALFAFTFSVIEVILLLGGVKDLFRAVAYLGQRGDASALILPFSISKRGRLFAPERLEFLTYVFIIYKAAATALPEMLLLTKGVSLESYGSTFNLARLYPYAIILAVVSVFVFGIILVRRYSKYLFAIYSEGRLYSSADSLLDSEGIVSLKKKIKVREMSSAISVILIACLPIIDIAFSNLYRIDLLPDFLCGILFICAIFKLKKHINIAKETVLSCVAFTVSAVIRYTMLAIFLTEHSYEALVLSKAAKADYVPTLVAGAAELLLFVLLLVILAKLLYRFVTEHTGIDPHNERYSRLDAEFHKNFKKRIAVWCGAGIFSGSIKLCQAIFRYYASYETVSTDYGAGFVTTGLVPWFGAFSFAFSLGFVIYSAYLVSGIKEEIKNKYI